METQPVVSTNIIVFFSVRFRLSESQGMFFHEDACFLLGEWVEVSGVCSH